MKNILVICSLLLGTSLYAETVELKIGSVAPEDTPWSAWLKDVKKNAETKSNGQLKYKVYLGGRLGGEHAMVKDVQKGRLELFGGSSSAVASKIAPELEVFELPMIFSSDAEADFVLNEMRGEVKKTLEKRGLVFVMWAENGWHGFGR